MRPEVGFEILINQNISTLNTKNLLIWQKIICLKTDSFLEEEKSDGKLRGHVPAITEIIDRFSQQ